MRMALIYLKFSYVCFKDKLVVRHIIVLTREAKQFLYLFYEYCATEEYEIWYNSISYGDDG